MKRGKFLRGVLFSPIALLAVPKEEKTENVQAALSLGDYGCINDSRIEGDVYVGSHGMVLNCVIVGDIKPQGRPIP